MKIISSDEAAALVPDSATLLISGSGGGHAVPEVLLEAVERRFLSEGHPGGLTSVHSVGLGDRASRGVSRFRHQGMLRRVVAGTLVDSPALAELALREEIEAFTLPQGCLSQLMREMAAGRPGLLTRVGLHTFVDPRLGGGCQGRPTKERLVELVRLGDEDFLWYKPLHADIALIRATTTDELGNLTMEDEPIFAETLSMAQAVHARGGTVVAEVKRVVPAHSLPPKSVKVPAAVVDFSVVNPDQSQTYATRFSAAYAGQARLGRDELPMMPEGARRIIARRAALELFPGAVCNLGSGVSTGIAAILAEEDLVDAVTLTNEQGLIGGLPMSGPDTGAAVNYDALIDQPYQFDFYDGGGLDLAFLSFGEVGRVGDVNVSRLGDRIIGVGGFINISQGARKVIFGGTMTTGGLEVTCRDGRLEIHRDGRLRRFREEVTQISYARGYAVERGQEALYVTERAVFRASSESAQPLELIEVAPGVDVRRDVLAHMEFVPKVSSNLRRMPEPVFRPGSMGLMLDVHRDTAGGRPQSEGIVER